MEDAFARSLCRRIEAEGPIPFAAFMESALYDPEEGYYAAGRADPGKAHGDFTTAPQLSALFGRCLATLAAAADRALGGPNPFQLLEGGAGEGKLARDLLDALRVRSPELYGRLAYAAEESGPTWAARQAQTLRAHAPRVSSSPPEPIEGLYLANELVDALPIHRLARRGGELLEVHVTCSEGELVETLLPPSRPELARIVGEEGLRVEEGCEAEVSLTAREWMSRLARRLRRGYAVIVDYGDEASRLYGPGRPRGTCLAYRGHRASEDLLAHPGRQDLTAHVDFTALRRVAEAEGLSAAPLLHQRDFLFALGLVAEVEALEAAGDLLEALEARRALAPLLFSGPGMGDFKVLVLARDAPLSALPLTPSF